MSMFELVERIEKEANTVNRILDRVKNITRDDGDILNRLDDLGSLQYGVGVLAGFNIVLTMIGELEVEA